MSTTYMSLPESLPSPVDDGACSHLVGMALPRLRLPSTLGGALDLASLPPGRVVIFAYPMTGLPGVALPDGWDTIPGARGCTPQNCAIRDHHRTFADLGTAVFALSTQPPAYQAEMAHRLRLPYPVLSDEAFALTDALGLPTFQVDGMRLIRRLTLIVHGEKIEKVFYPVFPPDRSAEVALDWLRSN